jgi:hypothetical protein
VHGADAARASCPWPVSTTACARGPHVTARVARSRSAEGATGAADRCR